MNWRSLSIPCSTLLVLLSFSVCPAKTAQAAKCCGHKASSKSKVSNAQPGEVLPPNKFFGQAAVGYSAAKAAPEVCAKLFCYCGCDLTDSHSTLLDCFTCDHGADCQICQEEAIIGLRMKREGKDLYSIQSAIDKAYSNQYPWDEPSEKLIKYRESLKPPLAGTTENPMTSNPSANEKSDATSSSTK